MSRAGPTVVAWTGHRPDLFRDPAAARESVEAVARELAECAVKQFLVGGQRGVDTWAALAAMALSVRFTLILPFRPDEFASNWSEPERALLGQAIERAGEVRVANGPTARNQMLAREADLLVAVWTGTTGGGTAETLRYARQAGTPVREILLEASSAAASATGPGI
jgi:predicted Rossmann-fold nucleotide-binding protein